MGVPWYRGVTEEEADSVPANNCATETADVRSVPVETEAPAATKTPEAPATPVPSPTPTAIAAPVEEAPPATSEARGNRWSWIFLLIAIGGVIFTGWRALAEIPARKASILKQPQEQVITPFD